MSLFIRKFLILNVVALSLGTSVFASNLQEDSKGSSHPQATASQAALPLPSFTTQEDATKSISRLPSEIERLFVEHLPVDKVFQLLLTSKGFDHPNFWQTSMLRFRKYDPTLEATKVNVTRYALRVWVNTESDPEKVTALMERYKKYDLNKGLPFREMRNLIFDINNHKSEFINLRVAQKNQRSFWKFDEERLEEMEAREMSEAEFSSEERSLNDAQIEMDDPEAIERRIIGKVKGEYGYTQNPAEAIRLNEELVAKDDPEAICRKIHGPLYEENGYKINPEEFVELNDKLADMNKPEAIERKYRGHLYGWCGYAYNLTEFAKLNDKRAEMGDLEAIDRKLGGLKYGTDGYMQNPQKFEEFIISLTKYGNPTVIRKKFPTLVDIDEFGRFEQWTGIDIDDYEIENPKEFVELNDKLADMDNPEAIERRIIGKAEGKYGYTQNPAEAIRLNEELVAKGNPEAIKRKLFGLLRGTYGYEENSDEADKFKTDLIKMKNSLAIEVEIADILKSCWWSPTVELSKKLTHLNDVLVNMGDPEAIEMKIKVPPFSMYDNDPNEPYYLNGSIDIFSLIINLKDTKTRLRLLMFYFSNVNDDRKKEEIEIVEGKEEGLSYYLKALSFKFGFFGVTQDLIKAREYILANSVPY